MKPDPLSPYAVAEITGEYYARIFSETCDLKAVCLRYYGEELGAGKDTMPDFNPSQLSSAKKSKTARAQIKKGRTGKENSIVC